MSLLSEKIRLRQEIRALKRQQTPEMLTMWSQQLCELLQHHPDYIQAQHVMLYAALPDEPDLSTLLQNPTTHKHFYLPRVVGEDIEVVPFVNDQSQLEKGAFGITEPTGAAIMDFSVLELVIVPGMAFDIKGHRLGRGRGYYDRFFTNPQLQAHRIGVAFPFQILEQIPYEAHDVVMHEVLRLPNAPVPFV